MSAFKQKLKCDSICANCTEYEEDFEVGGMFGLCLTSKLQGNMVLP